MVVTLVQCCRITVVIRPKDRYANASRETWSTRPTQREGLQDLAPIFPVEAGSRSDPVVRRTISPTSSRVKTLVDIGFRQSGLKRISYQPLPHVAEKILPINARLFENLCFTVVFERDFLQENFDGIFWLESLRNESSYARWEAVRIDRSQSPQVALASVGTELSCC
jgi:hypothetical protein